MDAHSGSEVASILAICGHFQSWAENSTATVENSAHLASGGRAAYTTSWISPQARHTTDPSITDSLVLPQAGQRSDRARQVGSAAWQSGQSSTWRPPVTSRAQGDAPFAGSVWRLPHSSQGTL